MKKIFLILISLILIGALGYIVYMMISTRPIPSDRPVPIASTTQTDVSEKDRLDVLKELSNGTSSEADGSVAEKKAVLQELSASSNGTSTSNAEAGQSGPSEAEKMEILKALSK